MTRRRQVFRNSSDRSLILFLELSTARFRLSPGRELVLLYEDDAEADGPDAPLRIEYMFDGDDPQIVIHTDEDAMFLADGTEAVRDYS
ncbi:hypothetical protein [Sphingomonas sp. LM7]|uniref:hypothetical protein n=1 Tax=Sphingomonas sp. LM7 TaxID=1938607 RepID=UPI000983D1B7|nr:hypothetical protein [Sphingomonas sp. LM7]AQR72639.1 hypothetical protein BXU08_02215 [Sphingomonas sp. LM7]